MNSNSFFKKILSLSKPVERKRFKKKIYSIFCRFDYFLNNCIQKFKRVENRTYKILDFINNKKLIAPTSCQISCIRRDLITRTEKFEEINQFLDNSKKFIVFDIGANIGYYSRSILQNCKHAELILIEPDIRNISFASFNLNDKDMTSIFNIGFGSKFSRVKVKPPITAKFRKGENKYNTGLFTAIGNEDKKGTRIITFDSFIKLMNIDTKKLGWIKIDVEGFELEVLKGMKESLNIIDAPIEIEINATTLNLISLSFQDIIDYLSKFDYLPTIQKGVDIENRSVLDIIFVKTKLKQYTLEFISNQELSCIETDLWIKKYIE